LQVAQEKNLGTADPKKIKIVGENINKINFGFKSAETLASCGQKLIYHYAPPWLEKILLQTFIAPWSYLASKFYFDFFWFNFVGKKRVNDFFLSHWGKLFKKYLSLT